MTRFWWGDGTDKRKIHWMSWEKMVEKKPVGGLGFRDVSCFNLAMLAKFGWRLLMDGASYFVARVLKAGYYPNTTFLSAECSANPLWAWCSVLAGRIILQNGIRWRVGNGTSIKVALDPWLSRTGSFKPRRVAPMGEDLLVSDLIDEHSHRW
ncbi:uncharacterized mitochondrial protein AtMg00310-like [Rhododendron vialii]|uniref:uncharacterized mitochondrial protein AtMg00310-like n=1 Tax=Rhododendron vialii TaxID=182163 RepID=UPI00265FF77C|nr:uncharacterized mitochondrial protein AtMg00310-like [Rhododendron vialii]